MGNLRNDAEIKKVQFASAKDIIEEVYTSNDSLSCYQSYQFLNITGKGFMDKSPLSIIFWSDVTYVQYKNGTAVAVVPLLKRKTKGKTELRLRGAFTSAGILNAIYRKDWAYDDFVKLIGYIRKDIPNAKFCVGRLPQDSLFLRYAKTFWNLPDDTIKRQECVSIPIPDSFDMWYQQLSKSVKQNYRTSLNRLKTDGLHFAVKSFWNQPMDRDRFHQTTKLYAQRLSEHNTKKRWMQKLIEIPLRFQKTVNPMSHTFLQMDSCFDVELYIQEELAAVCCGYLTRPDRAMVPRFYINTKFSRYSPGGILIAEIIKMTTKTGLPVYNGGGGGRITHVRHLDLSRGAEKYKYNYGGVQYFTYGFEVGL